MLLIAPGIVQIASVVSTSNITVNVFWTPPSQPNGVVTGYLVIYSVYQMDDDILSQMLNNTSNTNYSISGLSKSFCYRVMYAQTYILIVALKRKTWLSKDVADKTTYSYYMYIIEVNFNQVCMP